MARDDYEPYEPSDPPADMHMPSPSYYPIVSAFGIVFVGYGLVYVPGGWTAVGIGALISLWGLFGWSLEPVTRNADHD